MISSERLQQFTPMNELDHSTLSQLLDVVEVEPVHYGECLFKLGSKDSSRVYLLEGELELTAGDGRVQYVRPGQPNAQKPVASLVPRKYQVKAVKTSTILRFKKQALESVLEDAVELAYQEDEAVLDERYGIEGEVFSRILMDISQGQFALPSLPEIANRVLQLMQSDEVEAEELENLINGSPVLAAKLLKVANSALYSGEANITSVGRAIVRLGFHSTGQLVTGFAMEGVFQTKSRLIRKRMQQTWLHSTYVACLSSLLANKIELFDPGKAMLAGLIHDIGVVAILTYLDEHREFNLSKEAIELICHRLRGEVGSMILSKWNFPKEFSGVVEGAEDWHRNSREEADLADLIMIAQLHAYIQNPTDEKIPSMFELPAFEKLGLNEWSPQSGLEILHQAKNEINKMVSIFSMT